MAKVILIFMLMKDKMAFLKDQNMIFLIITIAYKRITQNLKKLQLTKRFEYFSC